MRRKRLRRALLPWLMATLGAASLWGQSAGGLRVADETGLAPPGSVFSTRDQVFVAAGPDDAQCAGQGLADGVYSFEVDDITGTVALSADDISNRTFTASGGVIAGYTGNHAISAGTTACGSELIGLAPFDRAPRGSGVYLLSVFCLSCVTPDGTPAFVTSLAFAVRENLHCLETHCVSGTVFRDDNDNGLRDAGEPGLADIVVTATSPGQAIVYAQTGLDGSYSLCGLPDGDYTISAQPGPNFHVTAPASNQQISRYLSAEPGAYLVQFCNQDFAGLDFGAFPLTGTITGLKFNDANGNGVQDAGETGLAGIAINLLDVSGNAVATQTTAADGTFELDGVSPGQYSLTETLPSGFEQTVPGGDGAISVTVVAGQTSSGNVFGNHALPITGTLSGLKFNDANGNGVQDAGEGSLANVTINLLTPAGTILSTVTAADGTFSFPNLDPGSYTVGEVVPAGYHQTFPAPPGTTTITVTAGQSASVLFGNQSDLANPASISGFIFYDLNKDGVQDHGEIPFAAVTVNLMDTSGNVITTTVTDANGNFSFSGVPAPGDYLVQPVPPTNFFQTVPADKGPIAVHVDPGANVTNLVFALSC